MDFNEIWVKYPKKLGKKQALKYFKSSVKTSEDYLNIQTALNNYLKYIQNKESQYIQHASTWFNNWEDWVDYEDPKAKEDEFNAKLRHLIRG